MKPYQKLYFTQGNGFNTLILSSKSNSENWTIVQQLQVQADILKLSAKEHLAHNQIHQNYKNLFHKC
jgi:hypothetical protein